MAHVLVAGLEGYLCYHVVADGEHNRTTTYTVYGGPRTVRKKLFDDRVELSYGCGRGRVTSDLDEFTYFFICHADSEHVDRLGCRRSIWIKMLRRDSLKMPQRRQA
jgi:hypothetical protein